MANAICSLLAYEKAVKFALYMMEGLCLELKCDIEDISSFSEICSEKLDSELCKRALEHLRALVFEKIPYLEEQVQQIYEVLTFDAIFLSSMPEELERELLRLSPIEELNSILSNLLEEIESLLFKIEGKPVLKTIFTPIFIYRDLIKQSMEFNRHLGCLSV
ncbi:MAG: hypothetical protein NZL90_00570 [Aquificaceae bacterium]|nr:hypothetical protein [Aquificaceae bacterium]MDW8237254.1 hypothetical protein [Aquificaceae bacterium]